MAVWLEANVCEHADAIVAKEQLLRAYNQHASEHGMPSATAHAMTKAVNAAYPHVGDGQRRVSGRVTRCWLGIGLADTETQQ